MKFLRNRCYANKDGGMLYNPYSNINLKKQHLCYTIEQRKSGSEYKEHIKVNYESNLSVVDQFPYGTCSLMVLLKEDSKTWKHYLKISDEDRDTWDKKAGNLDMIMLFIQRCDSDEMQTNLEWMGAFLEDKYTQNIKLA